MVKYVKIINKEVKSVLFLFFIVFALMFDYLQQFNSLPKELKDKVSSPEAMSLLSELENRYQVDLAMIVMKVMIKSLDIKDLSSVFVSELGLSTVQAEALTKEIKVKIFSKVADYVGISSEVRSFNLQDDIDKLIKEAGISITSLELIERLKKVLATYVKGIRSRIDTRQVLVKDVSSGGLGLSQLEVDRVFKVCDVEKYQSGSFKVLSPTSSRLNEIMSQGGKMNDNKKVETAEYDLKKALTSGETKSIAPPKPDILENKTKDTLETNEAEKLEKKEEENITPKSTEEPRKNEALQELQDELNNLPKSSSSKIDLDKLNKDAFIVKKPEKSSLFRNIFTEEAKKTAKGSVKLAQTSGETAKTIKQNDSRPILENQKDTSSSASQIKETSLEKEITKKQPAPIKAEKSEAINKKPIVRHQPPVDNRRPRLDDVKVVPKVMGPLEELQFLDIMNFRRLGQNPAEITAKVFGKIKLLEREGYDKMIAGISAWKKSPVNRLYLKMMQLAIQNGKTIKEIANQASDKNLLTWPEIEAIINLNSRLTF